MNESWRPDRLSLRVSSGVGSETLSLASTSAHRLTILILCVLGAPQLFKLLIKTLHWVLYRRLQCSPMHITVHCQCCFETSPAAQLGNGQRGAMQQSPSLLQHEVPYPTTVSESTMFAMLLPSGSLCAPGSLILDLNLDLDRQDPFVVGEPHTQHDVLQHVPCVAYAQGSPSFARPLPHVAHSRLQPSQCSQSGLPKVYVTHSQMKTHFLSLHSSP